MKGHDFALSEAGLQFLEATLGKGALKDGKPVREAVVVLADVAPNSSIGQQRWLEEHRRR